MLHKIFGFLKQANAPNDVGHIQHYWAQQLDAFEHRVSCVVGADGSCWELLKNAFPAL